VVTLCFLSPIRHSACQVQVSLLPQAVGGNGVTSDIEIVALTSKRQFNRRAYIRNSVAADAVDRRR
jgi:hypothetical protein